MESKGWSFSWNDDYVFRPEGDFCDNVPLTSYCGFKANKAEGVISYTFSYPGTAVLSYGHSWAKGTVRVDLNHQKLGLRRARGTSDIVFNYSAGDILQIMEKDASVINIHYLCNSPFVPGMK